jgi:hypothetical protein
VVTIGFSTFSSAAARLLDTGTDDYGTDGYGPDARNLALVEDTDASPPWTAPSLDWSAAACRTESGALAELFFSPELVHIAQAKSICSGCPLKSDCLTGALARQEACGVWGGELFVDGKIIINKRPRGRPRKTDPSPVYLRVIS